MTSSGRREVHPLLTTRRSPRAFDETRNVARDDLDILLEAARCAPSCFNEQPWRYLICERNVDAGAWNDLLACLDEGNSRWARQAPVLIAVFGCLANADALVRRLVPYDTGAATLALCLQASAMGMASHQLGGFDPSAVRKAFDAPDELLPLVIIALGYQANPESMDERQRAKAAAPRVRKPITEFSVYGRERTLS